MDKTIAKTIANLIWGKAQEFGLSGCQAVCLLEHFQKGSPLFEDDYIEYMLQHPDEIKHVRNLAATQKGIELTPDELYKIYQFAQFIKSLFDDSGNLRNY